MGTAAFGTVFSMLCNACVQFAVSDGLVFCGCLNGQVLVAVLQLLAGYSLGHHIYIYTHHAAKGYHKTSGPGSFAELPPHGHATLLAVSDRSSPLHS